MTGPEFAAWRSTLALTQHGAANALGLNLRTIQRYEAGTLNIPQAVILASRWLTTERQLFAILRDASIFTPVSP